MHFVTLHDRAPHSEQARKTKKPEPPPLAAVVMSVLGRRGLGRLIPGDLGVRHLRRRTRDGD